MASRLSERDRILLGYPPQPNPAPAASDLDFADVFGGPPRSSSLSDSLRQSLGDSLDLGSSRVGERPVFGEISSPSRRRHLKDDFFSDIFQSGESACSSPRRGERDFFNSPSPGSRVLSPTRPLPPARAEVAAGGYSQPAQLSFSLKSAKGIDHPRSSPTPRSQGKDEDGSPDMLPSPAAAFMSSFPARAVMAQDDMIVDGSASYHRSPLSRQVSHNLEKSSAFMDSTVLHINSHSKKVPTTSLEDYVNKGQFHFSIYKWAGKGVTLVMPSKSNLSHQGRLKRLPEVVVQAVDMILQEDNMSNLTTANRSEREDADELLKDVVIESKNAMDSTAAEATMTAGFGTEFLHSDKTEKSVNEEIARQVEGTDDLPKSQQSVQGNIKAKEQTGKKNKRSTVKVTTPTMRAPVSPEEKMRGSRVKEKVKDFIRIFNQEGSPKRKGTSETSCRGSKGNDNAEGKEHDQDKVSGAKASEPVKSTSKRDNSTLSEPFIPINQNVKMAEEVNFIASFDGEMTDETSFERKDTLTQCSDPTPDVFDTSVCNAEEDSHYEDLEGVLVEPLSHNQNEDLPTSSHQDQIKSIDGKIREWSKGKEGNIRSLISTLQFVLWPESGWKPVRLVDIIEGSSVKRAYQKALLCLHPDKLQQKGASAVQKYLAEKVFDIMQEAWEQFNTITQITWT